MWVDPDFKNVFTGQHYAPFKHTLCAATKNNLESLKVIGDHSCLVEIFDDDTGSSRLFRAGEYSNLASATLAFSGQLALHW